MTDLGSLTRRYNVIGAFDGTLTIVTIVLGALAAIFNQDLEISYSHLGIQLRLYSILKKFVYKLSVSASSNFLHHHSH